MEDQAPHVDAFEKDLESLRTLLGLPGLQVAIVQDNKTVLERAYGYADLKAKTPMTTDHLLELASVTKTMTAVVIMQLVEEGKISLDDRVIKYPFDRWFYPTRITPEVRLRHVLSHTSQGPPGETYCYQGNRFGFVYGIFGTATPEKFIDGEATAHRIFVPLHMKNTLPQPGIKLTDEWRARLATNYGGFDATSGEPIPLMQQPDPKEVFPSSGFFSTVKDLALYAVALQNRALVSERSHAMMEAPVVTSDGRTLPYGLGWATQSFAGERLLWHYGYGNGSSALFLRVPSRKITLIVLANSSNMSESTRLGYGNVLNSPFAVSFLKHFIFASDMPHAGPLYAGEPPAIRRAIADLRGKKAHPLYFEELFTRAVILEFMAGPNRDRNKSAELLHIAQEVCPSTLLASSLIGLELLSRHNDPLLKPSTEALHQVVLKSHPAHPATLYFGSKVLQNAGRETEAISQLQRLADSSFDDEILTVDACIEVGDHLAASDPKRARAYYWRAVQIGFAGSSYPRAKMNRAIESLNATGP